MKSQEILHPVSRLNASQLSDIEGLSNNYHNENIIKGEVDPLIVLYHKALEAAEKEIRKLKQEYEK